MNILNTDLEALSIEEIIDKIVDAGFKLTVSGFMHSKEKYDVSIKSEDVSVNCLGDNLRECIVDAIDELKLKLTDSGSDLIILDGNEKVLAKRLSEYDKMRYSGDVKKQRLFQIGGKFYFCIGAITFEGDKNLYYKALSGKKQTGERNEG